MECNYNNKINLDTRLIEIRALKHHDYKKID